MAQKVRKYETSFEEEYHGHTLETEIVVEYTFEPGEPCIMYGDNAQPGCEPSVEIDEVTVKATGEVITLPDDVAGYIVDDIMMALGDE